MTEIVYRVKTALRVDPVTVAFVLVTTAALAAATTAIVWTEAVGLPLAAFMLIEGSGVGALWRTERQRARREIQDAARIRRGAVVYGSQIAQALMTLENMSAVTQVLPVVHSTVYRARSHPLEDGRSIEMWSRLHEDTGDIARR